MKHLATGIRVTVLRFLPAYFLAGKTFTMLGTDNQPGIIPRCVRDLFAMVDKEKSMLNSNWKIDITFSYLEIYNEKARLIIFDNLSLHIVM